MSLCLIYFVLLVGPALTRHVPNYSDLDEDEQELFRAAYDAPSYNQEYEEEEDLTPGKLDLVKDGLWALKAKMKQLKAFNKALAANMLSTKLKLKDLLKYHMVPIKQHHHEKPAHHAPAYSYEGQYAAAPAHHEVPYNSPAQYAPALPLYQPPPAQYRHDPYYGH